MSVPPAGEPTGSGIGYLALVDGVALFTVLLIGVDLFEPAKLESRV